MNESAPSQPSQVAPEPPAFSIANVLVVIGPILLIFVGGVGIYAFFGNPLSMLGGGKLAPIAGVATIGGEPIPGGIVRTEHENGLPGALGSIESDGTFKLFTEIKGSAIDGAYLGNHKVTVSVFRPPAGFGPSTLVSPEEYADFSQTPFKVTVGNTNEPLKLALEGDPIPESVVNGESGGGGGPGGGPGGGFQGFNDSDLKMDKDTQDKWNNAV
ncbi:MAG: hypothetical protein QGG36_27290, partial [Pirellulaceae bacterium]|nr:hypothetical protein [Pirellulaceae bacterium]